MKEYSLKSVLFGIILLCQLRRIAPGDKDKNIKLKKQLPVDIEIFTPEFVTPFFQAMRQLGETKREKQNRKIKKMEKTKNGKRPYSQFLLITIASDEEIYQSATSFPDSFINSGRLVFIPNKRDHGEKYYNTGRELHGEVIALHFGKIKKLMEKFKSDPKTRNTYPIILLYSHYIPCAHVPNLGYSCSEELMNYAKGRIEEFRMLVA